jgi:hypothetical protein
MKIVTLYSPSHKGMLEDFFLPSLPKDDRLQLKIVEAPQLAGDSPQFNSPEWKQFMYIKAKLLYDELLSIGEGEIYGFLDVDIVNVNNFHDYIAENMKDLDFVCQSDSPSLNVLNCCTGVIFFKNTENTRNLLKAVNQFLDKFQNEQEALTYFARERGRYEELKNLKFGLLPFNRAFTYGCIAGQVWDGTDATFPIPSKETLFWLHANFAHHEQKIPLLNLFKQKLNA